MLDLEETIKVIGNSEKHTELTYKDLISKKLSAKVEVKDNIYYARISRWYRIDKEFKSLSEATSYLINFMRKIDKIKSEG